MTTAVVNVPHFTITFVFGQVATIPMKAVGKGSAVLVAALAPSVKETVNTPVGAAVTRVQPPVPKLSAPLEAFVHAIFKR